MIDRFESINLLLTGKAYAYTGLMITHEETGEGRKERRSEMVRERLKKEQAD